MNIGMGDRIRFRRVNYASDFSPRERTDEILEGRVCEEKEGGFGVSVSGEHLPFYVLPADIINE